MASKNQITGYILAGGKSSRMGSDKGLLELNKKKLVQYIIEVLQPFCTRVCIITENHWYNVFNLETIPDLIKNSGPLAGIYTGLQHSQTPLNFFLSCDSPFIQKELLQAMLNNIGHYQAIVPEYNQRLYPLTSIFKKETAPLLLAQLQKGQLSVKKAIQHIHYLPYTFENQTAIQNEVLYYNINKPEDLKQAKKMLLTPNFDA